MRFWPLDKRKNIAPDVRPLVETLQESVHRLEIECRRLRERLDDLDGRHSSLSAQFRGRMGGRPPKNSGVVTPLPIGAQHFPPQQEQR